MTPDAQRQQLLAIIKMEAKQRWQGGPVFTPEQAAEHVMRYARQLSDIVPNSLRPGLRLRDYGS